MSGSLKQILMSLLQSKLNKRGHHGGHGYGQPGYGQRGYGHHGHYKHHGHYRHHGHYKRRKFW